MSVLGELAADILEYEFDGDSSIATSGAISGWLEANLGQLNSLIYTEYSGADAALDLEAQSIHKELYLHSYYTRQSRNALRGIAAGGSGDVLSLSDADSSVTFVNRNEVAKVYRGLAKDHKESVDKLVGQYNIYQSEPRQVAGVEGDWYTGTYP